MKTRLFFFLSSFFALSACSSHYASNAENEYLHSRHGKLVVVPAPLTKQDFSQYYILPTPHGDPRVSIAPPIDDGEKQHVKPSRSKTH